MQSRGIISSMISIAGLIALFSFHAALQQSQINQSNDIPLLLSIEQSEYDRTELEQNAEQLVRKTIEAQILLGNTESKAIEAAVQQRLLSYYASKESESVRFFSTHANPKPYRQLIAKKNREDWKSALSNWKVLVVSAKKGLYWVRVQYTGGALKNHTLNAIIERNNARSAYSTPIGFEQSFEVVG